MDNITTKHKLSEVCMSYKAKLCMSYKAFNKSLVVPVACMRLFNPLWPSIHQRFCAVFASMLLPECTVIIFQHCPCPPTRDLSSIVSGHVTYDSTWSGTNQLSLYLKKVLSDSLERDCKKSSQPSSRRISPTAILEKRRKLINWMSIFGETTFGFGTSFPSPSCRRKWLMGGFPVSGGIYGKKVTDPSILALISILPFSTSTNHPFLWAGIS